MWQSLGVVAVALVVGTVAGVAAGASVWVATTDGIGVATDINRPLSAIGLWSVAVLAAALALGTLAGVGAGGSTSPSRCDTSDGYGQLSVEWSTRSSPSANVK